MHLGMRNVCMPDGKPCTERRPACQDTCERYLAVKAQQRADKDRAYGRDGQIINYLIDRSRKR